MRIETIKEQENAYFGVEKQGDSTIRKDLEIRHFE